MNETVQYGCTEVLNFGCPLCWWCWSQVMAQRELSQHVLMGHRAVTGGQRHSVIHDSLQEQMSSGYLSSPIISPLLTRREKYVHGENIMFF